MRKCTNCPGLNHLEFPIKQVKKCVCVCVCCLCVCYVCICVYVLCCLYMCVCVCYVVCIYMCVCVCVMLCMYVCVMLRVCVLYFVQTDRQLGTGRQRERDLVPVCLSAQYFSVAISEFLSKPIFDDRLQRRRTRQPHHPKHI